MVVYSLIFILGVCLFIKTIQVQQCLTGYTSTPIRFYTENSQEKVFLWRIAH